MSVDTTPVRLASHASTALAEFLKDKVLVNLEVNNSHEFSAVANKGDKNYTIMYRRSNVGIYVGDFERGTLIFDVKRTVQDK